MLYPLTFEPIFKERIWGGRKLEHLYHKPLPATVPVGESWEISDRPEDVSVISNGPLKGKTLHWLVENHGAELFGKKLSGSFPLLIKILDAQEKLSLQVHPPAKLAPLLGGEPKTEMWYIAHAEPGAELYVGLKRGATRAEFETKIKTGTVADCFHRVPVKTGDAMFLPSGRVHAIGAGLVIFEVQQNSDTTYRVFDWNRLDKSGKGRELHVQQSLASIDFEDFEPELIKASTPLPSPPEEREKKGPSRPEEKTRPKQTARLFELVNHELFRVSKVDLQTGGSLKVGGEMEILGLLSGTINVTSKSPALTLTAGQFCLVPACCTGVELRAEQSASFLRIGLGR
ncbi:MAG: type I phosphomannose isomerase catalytic subunit [Limisphaerales bacterium]